ncbi:MAG: YidC/Oxa1 family insertase periplasmic-domain containing protein [Patescibacteria group bacterium]|nr:YidC/Oxa1 family insertase periplasmic-domain containing protein [Patescibacteria group bacterium]
MQRSPAPFPATNFLIFILLSFGILGLNLWLMSPARQPVAEQGIDVAEIGDPDPSQEEKVAGAKQDEAVAEAEATVEPPEQKEPAAEPAEPDAPAVLEAPEVPPQWLTLGSLDPKSPYRMLVTLTNRGAAVVRIELNNPRYLDLEHRGAYLGHLAVEDDHAARGCLVQVVGHGTPADTAGLRAGDVITAIDAVAVTGCASLASALNERSADAAAMITVRREGKELQLPANLTRQPMEVIRPEGEDPLSMLMTFRQLGDERLPRDLELEEMAKGADSKASDAERKDMPPPEYVSRELPGLDLRTGTWEVLEGASQAQVEFRRVLPKWGVEVIKSYRLVETPPESLEDPDYKAYHLVLGIRIANLGSQSRAVAYQLDGPTGLPTEGWWYANKIGREGVFGGAAGMRDVIVHRDGLSLKQIGCPTIADDKFGAPPQDERVRYIGVDAQYFSAVLIPQKANPEDLWFKQWQPLRVGPRPEIAKLANTSCRLVSLEHELAPGESLRHEYEFFAGPKKPPLLAKYGLGEVVYYGWFGWLAQPMVHVLHFFHDYLVFNFGLAIIMLTVLVRGCMYPLSHKQALGAQKMQLIQPELKKLQEKYKNDVEGRTKAQQELFRKHNYNPLSGCLVLFIQLPIFMALYRSLMVDVELRGASLFTPAIRWCSNLAAPDMLFDWSNFMPDWIVSGQSMFALGPYFNLLPIITIALFIVQQKLLMPPATDDQTRMQQNMMKYMMLFMGVLFFKVASGLCIYFIASSLWGVAERKLLPHPSKESPTNGKQAGAARSMWDKLKGTEEDAPAARKRAKKSRRK